MHISLNLQALQLGQIVRSALELLVGWDDSPLIILYHRAYQIVICVDFKRSQALSSCI